VQGQIYLEPGVIVARAFEPEDYVICSELPAGRAAHHVLAGPFDRLPAAWQTVFEWCQREKLNLAGINWQIYGERAADPAQQQTFLYALLA
jgi:effector-binding domain-containing protein